MADSDSPEERSLSPVPADRRFDRAETSRILQRAVELQPIVPTAVAEATDGVTLAQLVAAAEEAGISADAVRRAASELATPEALRTSPWLGAPARLVEERIIPREIPATEFDAVTDEIRRRFGMTGVVSATPRGVTWSSLPPGAAAPQGRRIAVSLAVRVGKTVLRVEEDLGHDIAGYFGAGIGVGLMGAFVVIASVVNAAPLLAIGAPLAPLSSWFAARHVFRRLFERRRREASTLATELAQSLEQPIG
ncbi:MAG: hypothetical protein ACKVS7_13035 [Gemmatimonadaceae bacterium]